MKAKLLSALFATYVCSALPAAAARTISVSSATATEGLQAVFQVTLSSSSSQGITVEYESRDGSACALCTRNDYYRVSSSTPFGLIPLRFLPGEVSKVVKVSTRSDTCDENNETFFLDLRNPTGPASIGNGTGTGTIIDDDGFALCCCSSSIFGCTSFGTCCCGGVGEGIPADATTAVGVPITYGIQWSVPSPDVWRSLKTMDVRLIGDGEEPILTVRWDEDANTFSLLNPGTDAYQETGVVGSPKRFAGPMVALLLDSSEVIGSGPSGQSVLLNLSLIFRQQARGRTFHVEARITTDSGIEQGYDRVGTITIPTASSPVSPY